MPDYTNPLGRRIRQLREGAGLSQRRLAIAIGVSPQHLSNVETGNMKASARFVELIAPPLHVDPSELLLLDGKLPVDVVEFMTSKGMLAVDLARAWARGEITDAQIKELLTEP